MTDGHFRLGLQKLQRAGGRGRLQIGARVCHSIVAAAAYRSGTRLRDQEIGKNEDYRRRQRGVIAAEIILPAEAPPWASDREKLWNAVQSVEKRKGAVLGYEFVLSIPIEIAEAPGAARNLVREWVRTNLVDHHGVAADVAWHSPGRDGDARNFHAHIIISDRKFSGGEWAKKAGSRAEGELGSTSELKRWRSSWAAACNLELGKIGSETRVDHRSRKARGLSVGAQLKEGKARHMERRGVETDRGRQITTKRVADRFAGASIAALAAAESQFSVGRGFQFGANLGNEITAAITAIKGENCEQRKENYPGTLDKIRRAQDAERQRKAQLDRLNMGAKLRSKNRAPRGTPGRVR
jgi:hypothetical protein